MWHATSDCTSHLAPDVAVPSAGYRDRASDSLASRTLCRCGLPLRLGSNQKHKYMAGTRTPPGLGMLPPVYARRTLPFWLARSGGLSYRASLRGQPYSARHLTQAALPITERLKAPLAAIPGSARLVWQAEQPRRPLAAMATLSSRLFQPVVAAARRQAEVPPRPHARRNRTRRRMCSPSPLSKNEQVVRRSVVPADNIVYWMDSGMMPTSRATVEGVSVDPIQNRSRRPQLEVAGEVRAGARHGTGN